MPSARTPNKRNELRSRTVTDYASGGVPAVIELDYDRNGNLTSDGERHRYVFNPFGQLVRILDYTTSEPVAEFAYSGVGHRISEKTDIDDSAGTGIPDATLDADDPTFYIATDPQGRRVATFRAGDTHPKETFVWTPAGVSGPGGNVGGALILRDRVDDAAIPSKWANEAAGESRPERHYHCSDSRQSVVALIGLGEGGDGPTGVLAEQYRYSATGVPYGIPLGDVDGNFRVEIDGEVVVDSAVIADLEQEAVYQVRADLNLDGLVDSADIAIADAATGAELGRGRLSMASVVGRYGVGGLERTGVAGGGWSSRSGLYRDDLNRQVASETVSGSATIARDVAPPGCVKVPCPVGDCNNWSCTVTWSSPARPTSRNWPQIIWPTFPKEIPTIPPGFQPSLPAPDFSPCSSAASKNPLPSWSSECLKYDPEDTYSFANATCFCVCAGNSPWSQFVRACLRCMYENGASPDVAHFYCYAEGDKVAPGKPYLILLGCWALCGPGRLIN